MPANGFLDHLTKFWDFAMRFTEMEHTEIYFEYDDERSYREEMFNKVLQMDIAQILFHDLKDRLGTLESLKTLTISYGKSMDLCPQGQLSWTKTVKKEILALVPNELYPSQRDPWLNHFQDIRYDELLR
jgi:hypothetical protein